MTWRISTAWAASPGTAGSTSSRLTRTAQRPRPGSNVIANPHFGTVVTESGGGVHVARECTRVSAHAVVQRSGHGYLRRGVLHSRRGDRSVLVAHAPAGAGRDPYTTRHGFGYTVFEHAEEGIASELTTYVAMDAPVKFWRIKVRNRFRPDAAAIGLGLRGMGAGRAARDRSHDARCDRDGRSERRHPGSKRLQHRVSRDRVAFFDVSEAQRTMTGGSHGVPRPKWPARRTPRPCTRFRSPAKWGRASTPARRCRRSLDLGDGQEREVVLCSARAATSTNARDLRRRFRGNGPAIRRLKGSGIIGVARWGGLCRDARCLGELTWRTAGCSTRCSPAACGGAAGFYQSGGAFGFRDQLQDSMTLVHAEPGLIREHLLRCRRPAVPRRGRAALVASAGGQRSAHAISRMTYLWLPYAVCRYVEQIGRYGRSGRAGAVPRGPALRAGRGELTTICPSRSEEIGTLYEHCVRAIDYGLQFRRARPAADGLRRLERRDESGGHHGKGESVWLAFFLYDVLKRFIETRRRRGDTRHLARNTGRAAGDLRANIEQHALGRRWYRRAYFDDGDAARFGLERRVPNRFAAPSWAVISGAGSRDPLPAPRWTAWRSAGQKGLEAD